jgi:hypothetical protein
MALHQYFGPPSSVPYDLALIKLPRAIPDTTYAVTVGLSMPDHSPEGRLGPMRSIRLSPSFDAIGLEMIGGAFI